MIYDRIHAIHALAIAVIPLLTVVILAADSRNASIAPPSAADYLRIAGQAETSLRDDVLSKWFPAAVNPAGGFYQNFGNDWTRLDDGHQHMVVYQSRLTWMAAEGAAAFADQRGNLLDDTRHGLAFVRDKQWDSKRGGFFWLVDTNGNPIGDHSAEKDVYGISFAIYAAAANYRVTHDPAALDLAERGFLWLDGHAHDAVHGGYADAVSLDGVPLGENVPFEDAIGTPYGQKSMNSHIHLLEAFTALYQVWPDARVRQRLDELFQIVSSRIYTQPGYLTMFFKPDWTPVSETDSFGHDIETAYLLCEAAEALGRRDDAEVLGKARALVDHALQHGYDNAHGGFYNEADLQGRHLDAQKIWWVEAEGLNALLLMHVHFGDKDPQYWQKFVQTWQFIRDHQIDRVHGGWYPAVSADGTPRSHVKSDSWTECYHQGRALLNVSRMLHTLANR